MRIIGPPSGDRARVLDRTTTELKANILFGFDIAEAIWDAAVRHSIDPVGAIAQSYKETGGGTFRGQVTEKYYNTAGIKVRHVGKYPGVDDGDQPLAHAQFASWEVGATAHVQHLRAYAGWPVTCLVVDPRYALALRGPEDWCENFEDLGGKWAPSPTYGNEIVDIARRLQG